MRLCRRDRTHTRPRRCEEPKLTEEVRGESKARDKAESKTMTKTMTGSLADCLASPGMVMTPG